MYFGPLQWGSIVNSSLKLAPELECSEEKGKVICTTSATQTLAWVKLIMAVFGNNFSFGILILIHIIVYVFIYKTRK